ncbi:site-2 protease family protein [bacterium]|nr:site-2 protease family protein [bacterium]
MNFELYSFLLWIPGILFALTIHEFSHGYAALKLGDPTAQTRGRLTLNPLSHLDPLGTIMLLVAHFGWAKPVPVNPLNFQNPRRDMTLVSIAGPASNIVCAIIFGLILRLLTLSHLQVPNILVMIIFFAIQINLILAIFNMIPIPPLDGSKILFGLVPSISEESFAKFEKAGPMIIIMIIMLGSISNLHLLHFLIRPFVNLMNQLILGPQTLFNLYSILNP